MNRSSTIDLSVTLLSSTISSVLSGNTSFTPSTHDHSIGHDLFNSTTTTTTSIATAIVKTTTTTTLLRLLNSTRASTTQRSNVPAAATTTAAFDSSSLLRGKYFLFSTSFNRIMRLVELFILSLTLPLYAIVLILFIELTVQRISANANISGGGTRSRSQRRRQRMRSLIWTSNYLIVDFLGLLYELVYVIIHLTGELALESVAGRFYCQLQVYLPLYLTALMAYSLTAISIYRRRHFVNLHSQVAQSTRRSLFCIVALWLMPLFTSIFPAVLLTQKKILQITQHETTNECQISYTYNSTVVAIYMCYRLGRRDESRGRRSPSSLLSLGNIFLLPLSVSFACYLTICIDLIRMQRRFTRTFKRHVHIRKNLILQILFLFLNFAVFWLPAEIITLYTKSRTLKDTVQVTKSLNILLDPLIITGFDTRFSSAAQQLLSKWRLDGFICFLSTTRPSVSSSASLQLISTRTGTTIKRLKQSTLRRSTARTSTPQPLPAVTWNIADDDDISALESTGNHVSIVHDQQARGRPPPLVSQRKKPQPPRRKLQQAGTAVRQESTTKRSRVNQKAVRPTINRQPSRNSQAK